MPGTTEGDSAIKKKIKEGTSDYSTSKQKELYRMIRIKKEYSQPDWKGKEYRVKSGRNSDLQW